MKRCSIRDSRAPGPVKTRVLDYIINDDGSRELEIKKGKVIERISYDDFRKQIADFEKMTTEP